MIKNILHSAKKGLEIKLSEKYIHREITLTILHSAGVTSFKHQQRQKNK